MNTPLILQINPAVSDSLSAGQVTEETLSIWELLQGGGWYIMIPLAALSILAIYIFAERWMAISKAQKEDK